MANNLRKYKFTGGSSATGPKPQAQVSHRRSATPRHLSPTTARKLWKWRQKFSRHWKKTSQCCSDRSWRLCWRKNLETSNPRRSNIRILNVPKTPGSSTPTAVSKLLREALKMDKDVLIDQSHRGLQPRSQEGEPRVIVAKLHYYQDRMDILRRAREFGPLRFNDTDIHIFPDYPPSVVHVRSAFNKVRRLLRGRDGVKYGLLYPAGLRITFNGAERRFQNPEEAMTYVKTKIMSDIP